MRPVGVICPAGLFKKWKVKIWCYDNFKEVVLTFGEGFLKEFGIVLFVIILRVDIVVLEEL